MTPASIISSAHVMMTIADDQLGDSYQLTDRRGPVIATFVNLKGHSGVATKGPVRKQKKGTYKNSQHGESVKVCQSQSWIYIVIVTLKSHVHASRVYSKFDPYTFYKIQAV
ncbi:hypothetical protein BU17DRAFT_68777 [Hysterangium stoloniferum]|nr:hypothetical protein BU17DRAFT_68777 [Hysterangium stoloniferum]